MSISSLPLTSIGAYDWTFCEGSPKKNWQFLRQEGKNFSLDACINLDDLCTQKVIAHQSEAVLYATIKLEQETNAILGMGCNWYFEAYCDGKLLKSTYETGNGSEYIFPANHRINFLLGAGEHLLALRVKRGENSWHFACGYCSVEAPPEPELAQGPWLSNPDIGLMTVNFTCKTKLGCAVQYRSSANEKWHLVWKQRQGQCLQREFHAIKLTDLLPGQSYEYQIITIHPDKYIPVPISEIMTFKAPDDKNSDFSFFFTADLQFPLDKQNKILDTMLQAADAGSCDFFVFAGDINSTFMPMEVISGPFAQLKKYGSSSKAVVYVRGNHEMRGDFSDNFLDYFATNEGTTYDLLRFGDTAFLILDAWEDKPAKTPGHTYCQWNLDQVFYEQESAWLDKAMQDEKWLSAKRRIVFCHGAPYSHSDRYKSINTFLQDLTDNYFAGNNPAHKINLWLTGHVHNYMRSIPGSDEIASPSLPVTPCKDGSNYSYPVLTVAGPGKREFQASCFRVDADASGFTLRSWCDKGQLIEHIRYKNDNSFSEIKSIIRHKVPAENK